jgi:hypothetical protein
MTEIGPNNFNEILLNVRRFRLTKEQVFRLWKCAVKDNDKLVDAAIEKLYEEMIAFDPARAESVVQLTINRDDTAELTFRGMLRDMTIGCLSKVGQYRHHPWGAAPTLSTTQRSQEPNADQELMSSQTTTNKSSDLSADT